VDVGFLTVGEAGTKKVLKLSKNDSIYNALKELRKYKTDRALIYEGGELVGIVTKKDVVKKIPLSKSKFRRLPVTQLHLSSIMASPVLTLQHGASVLKAARIMLEKNISSIPVTKKAEVTALFTKWDIAKLLVKSELPAQSIATYPVKTINKFSSIIHARRLIIDEGISTLPVVDENNSLVGILTIDELTDALADLINILAEGGSKESLRHVSVSEVMRPLVPSVCSDEVVGRVATLMLSEDVRGVVLVDEVGKINGIVTLTDLTRLLAEKASLST